MEHTADLVVKIRALREQAEKEMNRFTDVADYDVRRVTGRKPKAEAVEPPVPGAPRKRQKKTSEQTSIDFTSAPAEHDVLDGGEA
jgi:hypothetical protein